MKRFHIIAMGFLLVCAVSHGQEADSVVIFQGRGEFKSTQKILDFSYQDLNRFPTRAINPDIETLILDNNNLTKLPAWIGQLTHLKVLSLRNNHLKKLDFVINSCENLEQLYLSGNKELSDISSINTASKLEIIDVTDTKINALPEWVNMMDNLFYFKYTKKE